MTERCVEVITVLHWEIGFIQCRLPNKVYEWSQNDSFVLTLTSAAAQFDCETILLKVVLSLVLLSKTGPSMNMSTCVNLGLVLPKM